MKESDVRRLYQVIQGEKDNVEPNTRGKLLHGSPSCFWDITLTQKYMSGKWKTMNQRKGILDN
jgi:hypothetical protein